MGVRGLTTFIAKNQENYFKDYKLCDGYVVLDAHSVCAQIYKFYSKSNDCFGGDYDKYGRVLENFFSMLKQCNVTPIVVFDGGYEKRKLKTVYDRLKNKLKIVRRANPVSLSGGTVFPLFIREVFRDIVLKLKLLTARCDFEADFEIACIARQLNCPVISYDSDFYIFDVLYIPFPTLDFHVSKNKEDKTVYMKCKIYKIETFLKQFGGLDKSMIPLMATILGNDYIKKGKFKNFYSHLKLSRKKAGERSDQQRQITAVIKWLRNETYESAVRKILGRIKKKNRRYIARDIKSITQGYVCKNSEILEFLELSTSKEEEMDLNINVDDIESESDNEQVSSSSDDDDDDDDSVKSEEEEVINLDTITESEFNLPDWFVEKYRKSEFPTTFMDILSLTNCFYVPQVENVRNLQTIQISLPILKSIARILLHKNFTYFIYWARNGYGRVKKYNIDISDINLPTLNDINTLTLEKRKELLTSILNINEKEIEAISSIPSEWQLYIYSLLYWGKHAIHPTVTLCHIYSIILSMIHINIVDKQIGYYRTKMLFLNKYTTKLNTILDTTKKRNDTTFSPKISPKTITKDDCICFSNSFISNFKIDDKTASNPKIFSLDTVDAFAQFQNCLYFTKHLNSLLLYPFDDFNVSDYINGTFLYNLHTNFETRNDLNAYLELLLRNSPTILNLFQNIVNIIKSLLDLKTSDSNHKKRRRKRRKGDKNTYESVDNNDSDEKSNDSDIDVNNRFSVLRLVE